MSPVAQSSDALSSKTRSRPDSTMFPTISETRFNGGSIGSSAFTFNNFAHLNSVGHRSLSEEEQHLYNHHIIENFVESVREMNDVVLIPSKLKDLDSTAAAAATTTTTAVTTVSPSKYVVLNDDLYSYYQMINVVKNDLFEPHNHESKSSSMYFSVPKRKISRREQPKQSNGHSRNVSASNLNALLSNGNGNSFSNGNSADNGSTVSPLAIANGDSSSNSSTCSSNGTATAAAAVTPTNGPHSPTTLVPLTSDQLIGQNSKQLTVQFIHHLHSLYTILEHFTSAADFITERYQTEVESAI
ncbi:hypothetical protein TYRP_018630 [Tyrophagus putrescentiae]|nr:hypothetical protein TYRP_018630 [Tyrophagus putrescentiae]